MPSGAENGARMNVRCIGITGRKIYASPAQFLSFFPLWENPAKRRTFSPAQKNSYPSNFPSGFKNNPYLPVFNKIFK
jgi:hypothetical protein